MYRRLSFALCASLFATSCTDGIDVPAESHAVKFSYSPSAGQIPQPNDILFKDSLDATLNIPDGDPAQQALVDALNSLDGWSTSAPMSFAFDSGVDPMTVVAGTTVRVFEVTLGVSMTTGLTLGQPVLSVVRELVPTTDYVVAAAASDATNATYAIVPTKVLDASTSYMVVVTDGIMDADGLAVEGSAAYSLAAGTTPFVAGHPLAGLQVLVNAMESVASTDMAVSPAIAREDIVATFSFTTQSLMNTLQTVQRVSQGEEATVLTELCAATAAAGTHTACGAAVANTEPSAVIGVNAGTSAALLGAGPGFADIYTASLTLPYYLPAAANATGSLVQDAAPLTGRWTSRFSFFEGTAADPMETDNNLSQHNTLPLQTGVEIVPVLISLPNGASGQVQPVGGWPVVIFQHGITADRSSMIAISDSLSARGFACVAIDLPLHGIISNANPLHAGFQDGALRERTFGLDLVSQTGSTVTAAVPDMAADTSGAHFINLSSPQTQRDNLRQGVADLFAVVRMIQNNMNVDSSAAIVADDFDPSQIHFVGMSLGAIVGTTFLTVDQASATPVIQSATLNVPGGGIPRFLEASVSFGPTVVGGLAAAGVVQGTPAFDSFMVVMQTVIDSGDPVNFAPALAAGALPIMAQKVVGGGSGGGLTDQVIPNSVTGAPLSGTDPLLTGLGMTVVSTTTVGTAFNDKLAVGFSEGTHSSLLSPGANAAEMAANAEMQAQVGGWLLSIPGTPTLSITDGTVIDVP